MAVSARGPRGNARWASHSSRSPPAAEPGALAPRPLRCGGPGSIVAPMVRFARVYDERTDETPRVLVDRLWPRGVAKGSDAFDEWLRDVAPSHELRRWYG